MFRHLVKSVSSPSCLYNIYWVIDQISFSFFSPFDQNLSNRWCEKSIKYGIFLCNIAGKNRHLANTLI